MMTALGLALSAVGVLFIWAAITNKSPMQELRAALGGAGEVASSGSGGGGSFGGGGGSTSWDD